MLKINSNIFPKGGHRFKDRDGTTITGGSWPGVIARLRGYRKKNNIPEGDAEHEVMEQACINNPSICHYDDGQTAAAVKVVNLKSRVLQWFSKLRAQAAREPLLIGDQENATNRANVCAGCPQNAALPDGCSSCKAAVKELRIAVIGSLPADGRLVHRGCNILGADLSTQVWLDLVTVDNPDLPGCCWRRRSV